MDKLTHRSMLAFSLLAVLSSTVGGFVFSRIAHAGALDDRSPVTVQVSPREAFALHLILNAQAFKGDDQDAHARVGEVLGFAALDARSREIKRAEKREANADDFSDKLAPHAIPRDDIGRLVGWIKEASLPGVFNEVLNPLVRRLKKATGAP